MATAEMKKSSRSETEELDRVDVSDSGRDPEINKLFRICIQYGGSDLHLKASLPPMIRHKGDIRRINLPVISPKQMEKLFMELLDDRKREIMERDGGVDFAHVVSWVGGDRRFRV